MDKIGQAHEIIRESEKSSDTFSLGSDAASIASGSELLLANSDFSRLMIKKGDEVEISPTDHRIIRIIASIEPTGASRVLRLDGGPIHLADAVAPVFGIIRK